MVECRISLLKHHKQEKHRCLYQLLLERGWLCRIIRLRHIQSSQHCRKVSDLWLHLKRLDGLHLLYNPQGNHCSLILKGLININHQTVSNWMRNHLRSQKLELNSNFQSNYYKVYLLHSHLKQFPHPL